jgi:structural maintenance of chromosomes protein 5
MPAEMSRRRQQPSIEDEDEEVSSASRRLPPYGDGEESEEEPRPNGHSHGQNGTNDTVNPDGFQPGSIIRVKVENFVTYERAEFFPGPNLNMVIGPNGTGKSSLVCAICLGLGYTPKHLGRAGNVKEFVKHGKDTAMIEIELQKRHKDRANHIIRTLIRREQGTQKWWLNGQETTHKKIQVLVKDLKIQVDNLCQFLPQDRVVEFASSGPVDLLGETLRAAAPVEMLESQATLKELRAEQKRIQEQATTDAETLKNWESRQQGLQADVNRIREREEIKAQIDILKNLLICVEYNEAKRKYTEARDRKKEAALRLKQLQEDSGPSLEAVNQKQVYQNQVQAAVDGRRLALRESESVADDLLASVERAATELQQLEAMMSAEEGKREEKKREMGKIRKSITTLEGQSKNRGQVEFNPAEWNTKIVSSLGWR